MALHRHWLDLPNDIPGTKAKAPTPATPTKPAQPTPTKPSIEDRFVEALALMQGHITTLERSQRETIARAEKAEQRLDAMASTLMAMQREITALKYPHRSALGLGGL